MIQALDLGRAVELLRGGGVIAYPTEAVLGLGCDPCRPSAVQRLLDLKKRPPDKGLIIIASNERQIQAWIEHHDQLQRARASWPGPVTWVLTASAACPQWLCRPDNSVAIRITAHPGTRALCEAFGGAVVSTSANPAGLPPARNADALNHYFTGQLDGLLTGDLGDCPQPSQIQDARTGATHRA